MTDACETSPENEFKLSFHSFYPPKLGSSHYLTTHFHFHVQLWQFSTTKKKVIHRQFDDALTKILWQNFINIYDCIKTVLISFQIRNKSRFISCCLLYSLNFQITQYSIYSNGKEKQSFLTFYNDVTQTDTFSSQMLWCFKWYDMTLTWIIYFILFLFDWF